MDPSGENWVGDAAAAVVEGIGCLLGCSDAGGGMLVRDQSGKIVGNRTVGADRKSYSSQAKDVAITVGGGKLMSAAAGRLLKAVNGAVGGWLSRYAAKRSVATGGLSSAEKKALQGVADDFDTTLDVVGSRAAGRGRGVGTNRPVGKGPGTRSDIDVRIDSQIDINTGGRLSDALKNIADGLVDVRPRLPGGSHSPLIPIKPKGR